MRRLLALALFLVLAVPASATTSRILAPMDWWPVVSPDGSHVAFTRVYGSHMELDVVDVQTGRTVRLGSSAGQLSPTWSSDGSRVAYASGGVLYTVTASGADRRRYLAPTKAFAPAWRPGSGELAYLTTHGARNTDLWVSGALWARNVIGSPTWSPDGKEIAFQRDDGVYVAAGPGEERKLVQVANPGPPVWSRGGAKIAYAVRRAAFVVPVDGSSAPSLVANGLGGIGKPSFSADDRSLLLPSAGGVVVAGAVNMQLIGALGPGASYLGGTSTVVASRAVQACPGHVGIGVFGPASPRPLLRGSCVVAGTPRADVIEGTPLWGDVIVAGAGNDRIHANDGHTDRVDCGPGRDTVWADRSDRLRGCEVVHR